MKSLTLLFASLAMGFALSAHAQSDFVYVNNDADTNNSVSAYWVNHAGIPTELPGSPFATGGRGTTGGALQTNASQITTARHFLYASNDFDSNISAFEIEHNGKLEHISGSPFAAGTVEDCAGNPGVHCEGIPLATTPRGKYLFAGHPGASTIYPGSSEIYGYRIEHRGALVPLPGSPFNSGGPNPAALKVTADGNTLLALLFTPTSSGGSTNQIAVFRIGPQGSLTQVGSPTPIGNDAAALDIDCNGEIYVAEVNQIEIFHLAANGQITATSTSPVLPRTNGAVGDIKLSAFHKHLYETNFFADMITTFDIGKPYPTLVEKLSSPTTVGGNGFANKMALNARGNLLYATVTGDAQFAVLSVSNTGSLTPVTVKNTGQSAAGINTLTAYPRAPGPCRLPDDGDHDDD